MDIRNENDLKVVSFWWTGELTISWSHASIMYCLCVVCMCVIALLSIRCLEKMASPRKKYNSKTKQNNKKPIQHVRLIYWHLSISSFNWIHWNAWFISITSESFHAHNTGLFITGINHCETRSHFCQYMQEISPNITQLARILNISEKANWFGWLWVSILFTQIVFFSVYYTQIEGTNHSLSTYICK